MTILKALIALADEDGSVFMVDVIRHGGRLAGWRGSEERGGANERDRDHRHHDSQ